MYRGELGRQVYGTPSATVKQSLLTSTRNAGTEIGINLEVKGHIATATYYLKSDPSVTSDPLVVDLTSVASAETESDSPPYYAKGLVGFYANSFTTETAVTNVFKNVQVSRPVSQVVLTQTEGTTNLQQEVSTSEFAAGTEVTLIVNPLGGYVVPAGAVYYTRSDNTVVQIPKTQNGLVFMMPDETITVHANLFAVSPANGVTTFGASQKAPTGDTTNASPVYLKSGLQFSSIVYKTMDINGSTYTVSKYGTFVFKGNGLEAGYNQQAWYGSFLSNSAAHSVGSQKGD